MIALDLWPTATSELTPTFVLLGPKGTSGHRAAVATGSSRGHELRHLAVDGWQVEWSASVSDVDGTPVWIDQSHEWFDAAGNWLGEESAGASEPEDD